MPNSINIQNDFDKSLTCSLTDLDEVFKSGFDNLGSQYFGGSNGLFRIYPGFGYMQKDDEEVCKEDYDPRYRPWYVSATTGTKNVVLIIDTSGSMADSNPTRIEIAKGAALSVIDTLGTTDWVGIVRFSGDASSFSNQLVRVNGNNINQLKQYINDLQPSGLTNFVLGFQQAYQLIGNTQKDEFGSACQTVILFLTDGYDSNIRNNTLTANELYQIIDQLDQQYNVNATIFTYSLGTDADKEIPKQIACRHYGLQFSIADSSDPANLKTQMSNYYTFLAKGITINNVIWSQPFMSHSRFKGKEIVSGSLPVYYYQDGTQHLLGVAAVDVLTDQLKKYDNYDLTIKQLIIRSQKCSQNLFSPCQLEVLRGDNKCNVPNDCVFTEDPDEIQSCTQLISTNVICNDYKQTDRTLCCPGNKNCEDDNKTILIIAIVIPIVVVLIFGIIFYLYKRNKLIKLQEQQKKNAENKYKEVNNNNIVVMQQQQQNKNLQNPQDQQINYNYPKFESNKGGILDDAQMAQQTQEKQKE